jgi:hypothetical protein
MFEIRVKYTVQSAYSGTPITCVCARFRQVSAKQVILYAMYMS